MQPKGFFIYTINLLSLWSSFLHICSPFPLYSGEIFWFVNYWNYSYFKENGPMWVRENWTFKLIVQPKFWKLFDLLLQPFYNMGLYCSLRSLNNIFWVSSCSSLKLCHQCSFRVSIESQFPHMIKNSFNFVICENCEFAADVLLTVTILIQCLDKLCSRSEEAVNFFHLKWIERSYCVL